MKKKLSIGPKLYIALMFLFFYLPILVTMIFSFNSSKSLTKFTGFSLKWYEKLVTDSNIISAVYVSISIAIIATLVSTVLGTITAIGLSRSRKVVKEWLLNVNRERNLEQLKLTNRINDFVHICKNGERLCDNAFGTYSFLYTLCNYKCVSESKNNGPQSCKRGNGFGCNTFSGVNKSNSSND